MRFCERAIDICLARMTPSTETLNASRTVEGYSCHIFSSSSAKSLRRVETYQARLASEIGRPISRSSSSKYLWSFGSMMTPCGSMAYSSASHQLAKCRRYCRRFSLLPASASASASMTML
ncbi:unknown [Sinorhizobium phage PBC5]|nr:unknown [Sinorhizobium phage PBC5]